MTANVSIKNKTLALRFTFSKKEQGLTFLFSLPVFLKGRKARERMRISLASKELGLKFLSL